MKNRPGAIKEVDGIGRIVIPKELRERFGLTKSGVGIIKEVDSLGRIVLPKELRERFGIINNVEIVATEFGLLLRSPEYKLVKIENNDNK
ncbi:MAG: hypothetical protein IJX46_04040 [Clostridia bacterium]|nr:hypothetical protein [Clostridia bacterium]